MDGAMDDFSPTPKKNRTGLIVTVVVLILLAAGGYYFFNQQSQSTKKETLTPTVQPTVEPTATPEATPSGTITPTEEVSPTVKPTTGEVKDATELSLQVLNGSGTVGVAGEIRDHLSGKGYDSIDTGNADNFDYTGVTINIKSSRSEFLGDIQAALKDKYTLGDSGTLSSDSPYDAVIIVGK